MQVYMIMIYFFPSLSCQGQISASFWEEWVMWMSNFSPLFHTAFKVEWRERDLILVLILCLRSRLLVEKLRSGCFITFSPFSKHRGEKIDVWSACSIAIPKGVDLHMTLWRKNSIIFNVTNAYSFMPSICFCNCFI